MVVRYDEPSLHEVYIDSLSQIIKPKKAWTDQVRSLVLEKAPVEKKNYIPKTVTADEFLERGFFVENNCYHFADTKGNPHQRSNFIMSPLFHIESTINAKRLYEVKNVHNQTRVIEIPQKDLVSLSAFQINVESLGNFWWDGSQSDLNRLKRWLYEKTETCKEIAQLGWQKKASLRGATVSSMATLCPLIATELCATVKEVTTYPHFHRSTKKKKTCISLNASLFTWKAA